MLIVSLTSYYQARTATIVDKYVAFTLVGDSLGMVMHAMERTGGVTMEVMLPTAGR